MWRKTVLIMAIFSLFLVLPMYVTASVFEADQETASRTAMDFEGGYVEELAVDANGVVWAGLMFPNGIYYYDSSTSEWVGPPDGSDFGNVIDVEASDTAVYFIGGINLYRTTNNGSSWDELSPQNVGQEMYYDQNGDVLYVVSRESSTSGYSQLEVSSDEGVSFSTVEVDGVSSVSSVAASDTNIFVLTETSSENYSLFISTDSGSTWVNSGNTFSGTSQVQVSASTTDKGLVVVRYGDNASYSTDAGVTFSSLSGLVFGGKTLVIGTKIYCGGQYTNNYGSSWTDIQSSYSSSRNALAVDPNDVDALYTDIERGVAATADGGTTWSQIYAGLYGITIYDIAQSSDNDTVILAAYGGIAKTTDFTANSPTWTYPLGSSTATEVYIDDDIALAGMGSNIYYSLDAGDTWTDATADALGGTTINAIIKSGSTYYTGYGFEQNQVGYGGVVSSTDGITWTDTGLGNLPVSSLTTDSSGNIYAGMGVENDSKATKRGIYKYDGSTWAQLTGDIEGQPINDLLTIDDVIFAASGETDSGGIFRSEDAGATWESLDVPEMGWFHSLTYDPTDTDNIYVSTARPAGTGEVYKSDDGGDSWDLLYTGLKDEAFYSLHYSGVNTVSSSSVRSAAATKGFTGLLSGSNTLYKMYSKASLTVQRDKKKVVKNRKVKLTVTLKDAATNEKFKQKPVVLYKKVNKKWKKVKTKKTNNKGKSVFRVKVSKKTYFKAKWTAKKSKLKKEYGKTAYSSSRVTVKVKK